MKASVTVQMEAFDLAVEVERLHSANALIGAITTFSGYVRDDGADGIALERLYLEHYPGMTEATIQQIVMAAHHRWELEDVRVIHRVGSLKLGEPIVFVGVASSHRAAAFSACEYIVDQLKTSAPFWKKESFVDGSSRWVEVNVLDQKRLNRWNES